MEDTPNFREKFHKDDYGYITTAQINFFLQRPNGEQMMDTGHPSFKSYLKTCRVYNYLYDIMLEDEKQELPSRVQMAWDEKKEDVVFAIIDKDIKKDVNSILNYAWEDIN